MLSWLKELAELETPCAFQQSDDCPREIAQRIGEVRNFHSRLICPVADDEFGGCETNQLILDGEQ
jgi:hypothetical protein